MLNKLSIILKMLKFTFFIPSGDTVLLAELNPCHGELLYTWVKMLKDCHKEIVLVINKEVYNELLPLDPIFADTKIYPFFFRFWKFIFSKHIINRYQKVIFNSEYIYPAESSICRMLPYFKEKQKNILVVTHDMRQILVPEAQKIGLWSHDVKNFTPVYFQYFPLLAPEKKVNVIKNFIIVGGDNPSCRNFKILYNALQSVPQHILEQIRITVIGFNIPEIPEPLRKFFALPGRCSFLKLFQTIQGSDAILMLLDPENKEHLRYYSGVVSGNINLSFGFHCPMVIEKDFANFYGISENNGFVYTGNDSLAQTLTAIATMSADDYDKIRTSLAEEAEKKYTAGLDNLKKLLSNDL